MNDPVVASPARNKRAALIALSLFCVAMTLFWLHRIHIDQPAELNRLVNGDMLSFTWPNLVFLGQELRSGEIPFWNPYQYAGQPILANHIAAVLYPPNLLFLRLFSPEHALELITIFHLTVSSFFAWLFCRRLGLGAAACVVGAAVFTFSYPMIVGIYQLAFLYTQAWLPPILWALHCLLDEAKPRFGVALAVFVSLAFLGGHVQGVLYMLQFAGIYAAFGIWRITTKTNRGKVVGIGLLAGALCLGFSAPQLLPTALHHAGNSVRGLGGLTLEEATLRSMSLTTLWRSLFGADTSGQAAMAMIWPVLGLPLVALGVVNTKLRDQWFFLIVAAIVSGLFMVGANSPVFSLYHRLPLGDAFRFPHRMGFVFAMVVAVLIAIGIDSFKTLFNRRGRPRVGQWLAVAVALIVCIDVYARTRLQFYHPSIRESASAEKWTGRSPLDFLSDYTQSRDRFERVHLEESRANLANPKAGMMHRIFALPDYEPAISGAYVAYFRPIKKMWHGRLSVVEPVTERSPWQLKKLLDLMAVHRYAATPPDSKKLDWVRKLKTFAKGRLAKLPNRSVIVETPNALPRSYTVTCVHRAPNRDTAIDFLLAIDFDPRSQATVTDPEVESPALAALPDCASRRRERLRPAAIREYTTDELSIEADCNAPCLLVLSDLHSPGWRVEVDGRDAPIYQTNGIFRGVALGAGRHNVHFRYAPTSVRIGAGMFAFASLVSLWIMWRDRSTQPNSSATTPPVQG